MEKANMIVQGVEGRPHFASNGKLIPTAYPTSHPFTPTLLRGVLSGDLIEFEEDPALIENSSPLVENTPVLFETKEKPVNSMSDRKVKPSRTDNDKED